eukprot:1054720_1
MAALQKWKWNNRQVFIILFLFLNVTGLINIALYAKSNILQVQQKYMLIINQTQSRRDVVNKDELANINFTDVWYPTVSSLGETLKSIPARINVSNHSSYHQIIPRNIYQTWTTNSFSGPLMKQAVHSWIHLNPEYNYHFFNDQDCKEWIFKHCGARYLDAYLSINEVYGAARCDYFRYLLMWKWGGIYVDIDSSLNHPLRDWIYPTDEFVTGSGRDVPNQWILIGKQNHIIYRKAALRLTEKLEERVPLGKGGVIDLTGPTLLRRVYQAVVTETILTYRDYKQYVREDVIIRKIRQLRTEMNVGGHVAFKHSWNGINREMNRIKTRHTDINMKRNPFYVTVNRSELLLKDAR